jgi:hypothetical protein
MQRFGSGLGARFSASCHCAAFCKWPAIGAAQRANQRIAVLDVDAARHLAMPAVYTRFALVGIEASPTLLVSERYHDLVAACRVAALTIA